MPFVRNLWYMAAWSREIGESSFERTIAGRALQIVRRSHGELVVMHEGWHLACVERHTAVWVWLGAPAAAQPSQIADLAFLEDRANGRHVVTLPVSFEALNDLLLSPARLASLCLPRDAAAIEGVVRTEPRQVRAVWAVPGATLSGVEGDQRSVRHFDLSMDVRWEPPATLCITGTAVNPDDPPQVWIDAWIVSPLDNASSLCFYSIGNAPDKAVRSRIAFRPDEIDALVGKRAITSSLKASKQQAKAASSHVRTVLRELLVAEAGVP